MRTIAGSLLTLLLTLNPESARAQFPDLPPEIRGSIFDLRRGLENAVRSASQSKSDAPTSPLIDYQTAKSMEYDNQIKQVHTRYQRQNLGRDYQHARIKANRARYLNSTRKAPNRLSSSQYNPLSGRINWPVTLRKQTYDKQRRQLDLLFARHAAGGSGIDTEQYASIVKLLQELNAQLSKNARSMPPEQYSYARRFLEGLRTEARTPVGT